MIIAELRAAVKAAFAEHGIDQPKTAFVRIIRAVGNRVSVQKIDTRDNIDDANPIEVWPGVPGVTSDPAEGEEAVLSLVGREQRPVVTMRASKEAPGNVPPEVRHDATSALRMLSRTESAAAKVIVGNGALPVARAAQVDAIKAALLAYTGAIALDPTLVGIIGAAAALQTALQSIPSAATTKLEAE